MPCLYATANAASCMCKSNETEVGQVGSGAGSGEKLVTGSGGLRGCLLRIAISSNTAFSENFFKSLLIYVF